MDPLGEGLQVGGDAGDGAVGKAPAAVGIELFGESVEKRPRQAAGPEGAVIAPLLPLHEAEEASEVAALHRPGARGSRHLDGKVRLQPTGKGVGAAFEIEAHRQAGLPAPAVSGDGSSGRISLTILS